MASLEQWTKWREEYLLGLRQVIEDSPFAVAAYMLKFENKKLDVDYADDLVAECIEKGYINETEPEYFMKVYICAMLTAMVDKTLDADDFKVEYDGALKLQKGPLDWLGDFDGFYGHAGWFVNVPLLDAIRYYGINNPFAYKKALFDSMQAFEGAVNLSYCRVPLEKVFSFFQTMTTYGLYKLLVDMNCPDVEGIIDTIKRDKYKSFKRICSEQSIDFTEVSEIIGMLNNSGEISITSDQETLNKKTFELFAMVGFPEMPTITIESDCVRPDYLRKLFQFDMTDEQAFKITLLASDLSGLFPYLSRMDNDERMEINRILDNPLFSNYVKVSQFVYICNRRSELPQGITPLLSNDERRRLFPSSLKSSDQDAITVSTPTTSLEQQKVIASESYLSQISEAAVPERKTLASRWMTEPYHRMKDDTLVDLLSQKIWPQLTSEVDGLQWTPAKRALPSFEKTKNMLAACILFHALELAKIAKLPKQEEDEVSDVEYMSAEDRAQAGISATSNRDAGIVHTKKKYNDTLPVGYMEVLEKFIPEEKLPGRTTSRTYLKLVNKWVKMKLESVRDNIDSEASAKLFIAECKSDLGPQFYLYQDNRVKMKALLKEWKDQLPDIFNVPI